jgi:hypothetical protein
MLLTESVGVDTFPAQSVLVEVFPKNALLPVMLGVLIVFATKFVVEMVLVTTRPAGVAPAMGKYVK